MSDTYGILGFVLSRDSYSFQGNSLKLGHSRDIHRACRRPLIKLSLVELHNFVFLTKFVLGTWQSRAHVSATSTILKIMSDLILAVE